MANGTRKSGTDGTVLKPKKYRAYAVYRGDEFLLVGTCAEIARYLDTQIKNVYWYTSPAHRRRAEKRDYKKRLIFVDVEELENDR